MYLIVVFLILLVKGNMKKNSVLLYWLRRKYSNKSDHSNSLATLVNINRLKTHL